MATSSVSVPERARTITHLMGSWQAVRWPPLPARKQRRDIAGGPRTDSLLRAWVGRSGKASRVYYGPAIDLSPYRGKPITRAALEEVTELLRRRVGELGDGQRWSHAS